MRSTLLLILCVIIGTFATNPPAEREARVVGGTRAVDVRALIFVKIKS